MANHGSTSRGTATGSLPGKYLLVQLPSWLLAVVLAWALWQWAGLAAWAAVALVVIWIVWDLIEYPRMRRYYQGQPAKGRIVGETGVAVSRLAPSGFVRVHGELWQAELDDRARTLDEGQGIRVRQIRGLVLLVEGDPRVPAEDRPRY